MKLVALSVEAAGVTIRDFIYILTLAPCMENNSIQQYVVNEANSKLSFVTETCV